MRVSSLRVCCKIFKKSFLINDDFYAHYSPFVVFSYLSSGVSALRSSSGECSFPFPSQLHCPPFSACNCLPFLLLFFFHASCFLLPHMLREQMNEKEEKEKGGDCRWEIFWGQFGWEGSVWGWPKCRKVRCATKRIPQTGKILHGIFL